MCININNIYISIYIYIRVCTVQVREGIEFWSGWHGGYGGSPPSTLARGPGGCVSPRWGMPRGEAPVEIFLDRSYKKQDFPLFLDPLHLTPTFHLDKYCTYKKINKKIWYFVSPVMIPVTVTVTAVLIGTAILYGYPGRNG